MLKTYLKHKASFLLLQFIISATVTGIFLLDPFVSISLSNVLYINLLIIFWNSLYLLWDFQTYKKNLSALDQMASGPFSGLDPITQKARIKLQEVSKEKADAINAHQLEQMQFRDFINGWIHAIKTPVSAAKILLESLPYDDAHQKLNQEIESINYYINQTLFYARLENFSDDYHIQEHRITKIFNHALKTFKSSFFLKSLRIELNMEEFSILTDDKWLHFVISQLLSNAIKYADLNSKITITSASQDDYDLLKIHNQGVPIPSSDINRIFTRAYTGTNTRLKNTSTGMGLYLAKKCCDRLNHDLIVTSGSEGTTATLKFEKIPDYHQTSIFKA